MHTKQDLAAATAAGNDEKHRARLFQEMMAKWGESVYQINKVQRRAGDHGVLLYDIRVKCTPGPRGDYLVVIRAEVDGAERVAFVSGESPAAALVAACRTLVSGQLAWREPRPFNPSLQTPLPE